MIRNETEYQEASRRLSEEKKRLAAHQERLGETGLSAAELKRALDPLRSFQAQLEEEIDCYERLKRGDVDTLLNLHGLGRSLVALRIARGISQRDLAERIGVHESQVSRDERNDYHGITVERATRVLDALKVQMKSSFELMANNATASRRNKRAEK
jgi:DNA-binding Xre family transcriptional regulator